MTLLRPMTDAEFAAWIAAAIPAYAADKVASGQWTDDTALALSSNEHAALLPQGRATPDHHLLTVTDDAGVALGVLWFAVKTRFAARIAYVYNVEIDAAQRGRGHARRTFLALEDAVRELGLSGIALHVFGHNAGARALYERLGYAPTSISLFKSVGGAG